MIVSILGCGWLGLPLAKQLLKTGYSVKGSTTTSQKIPFLKKKGIIPFLIELIPQVQCENCGDFWKADVLIINIPSRGNEIADDFHLKQIESVANKLDDSSISRIIFVSSTSVYPSKCGIVSEQDTRAGNASRASGNVLLKAEKLLMAKKGIETTIIRFGGLYGYDRQPVKYLAGRTDLSRANAPVNLIHRDDCLNIIQKIMDENITGEVFNSVSDGHPPRKMYYTAAAESLDLKPPTFKDDQGKNYKIVSNRKLKELLDYKFKYPNPMDF